MSLPNLSLSTKLVAGCMVMLGFSLILSTILIMIFGDYYRRTDRDVMLMTMLKHVLYSASNITKERLPIAMLFDADSDDNAKALELLAKYRAAADTAVISILTPESGELNLSQDAELVAALARVRKAIVIAREDVDSIVVQPRMQRSAAMMQQGLRDMFVAIDLLRPIAIMTVAKIVADDPALAGPATVAQMLGDLRDYCGRFGVELVPFIVARSPLSDAAILEMARVRERITAVWQLAGRQGGLYLDDRRLESLRQQFNAKFFGQGMQMIDLAAATGRMTGDFGITAQELSDRFVPTLQPIEDLRMGFMEVAIDQLKAQRSDALIWLAVMSALAVVIVVATVALIVACRHYVLRPLLMASDNIVALSNGEELASLESPTDSREMIQLFDALEGLRIILGERAQHTERLKVLSETDGLTGLVNRRLFDRIGQGDAEFDALTRDVNLIMMDLDRFKHINDTYGHIVGDLVLKHAAGIVTRVCRKSDLAARYGGEEIAIVVLDSDSWAAMHVAERIRAELEAAPITLADGRRVHVTASFGVASGRRGGSNWTGLVKAADGALYKAKASGRNRVCRSGNNDPGPIRQVA